MCRITPLIFLFENRFYFSEMLKQDINDSKDTVKVYFDWMQLFVQEKEHRKPTKWSQVNYNANLTSAQPRHVSSCNKGKIALMLVLYNGLIS